MLYFNQQRVAYPVARRWVLVAISGGEVKNQVLNEENSLAPVDTFKRGTFPLACGGWGLRASVWFCQVGLNQFEKKGLIELA